MIPRAALERDLVIVACAISAGIHAALAPAHFGEGAAAGGAFLMSAALLGAPAVALTARADTVELGVAALVLAGLIASYALAVTSGLPVLHPGREPIEGLAVATKLVEAAGLLAAVDLLGRRASAAAPRRKGPTTWQRTASAPSRSG